MNKIILKARAKINLSLDVLDKRPDGYHNVRMIMQTVDLHDSLLMGVQDEGIRIKCNLPYVPSDRRNIVYKVAESFIQKYNIKKGVYINLRKNIPVAAGLGGGSADGAATLLGLNELFGLNLSKEELIEIGGQHGADIPYCILGGTALAEGIGDKITILPSLPTTTVLICKPESHISTGYVYQKLDLNQITQRPNMELLITAINNKDIRTLAANMRNVLETVTAVERPPINDIKKALLDNGALGVMMSGTGTSVFGLFSTRYQALKASRCLKRYSKEVFITNTVGGSIEKREVY